MTYLNIPLQYAFAIHNITIEKKTPRVILSDKKFP